MFVSLLLGGCALFKLFAERRYVSEINKLISVDCENIAFIRVLHDSGSWSPKLTVFCMFKDYDWMILSNVRKRNDDNIILYRYNGFVFYDALEEKIIYPAPSLLADKLGITLETYRDFINNKSAFDHFFSSYEDGTIFFLKDKNDNPIQLRRSDMRTLEIYPIAFSRSHRYGDGE